MGSLAFFSRRLTDTETKYSTFGRELLAIYSSVRHFRHSLEGREFIIFTDHKPLVYALRNASEKYSPREVRHLDYISQFSTNIQHVSGVENTAADALSRIHGISTTLDLAQLAAAQKADKDLIVSYPGTSINIQPIPIVTAPGTVLCDVSKGHPRPLVPAGMRRAAFDALHNLSHPGIRATIKLVTDRFIWPDMNRDLRQWTRCCLSCQRSKVHRHISSPLGTFTKPDARFDHVHIDIVGPLSPSRGHCYILTCVDRFTRWPEAIPIPDITSETVARNFVEHWIARYGCPSTITTDRGSQFESSLFDDLTRILGSTRTRTTAYHPQANGMVERFHRQLKASLCAHAHIAWTEALPLVLLGIRNTVKADLKCTSASLVYGCPMRLPASLIVESHSTAMDPSTYATRLASYMRTLEPAPPRVQTRTSYVPATLATSDFVFVRCDSVRRPLRAPYTGPFRVVRRSDKTFVIDRRGKNETISIDRLKPAFIDDASSDANPTVSTSPSPSESTSSTEETATVPSKSTRSGRRVHFPKRFLE